MATTEQKKNEKWQSYLDSKFPGTTVDAAKQKARQTVAWKTFIVDSEAVATTVANHGNTPNLPYDFVELCVIVDGVEKVFTVADFKKKLGF